MNPLLSAIFQYMSPLARGQRRRTSRVRARGTQQPRRRMLELERLEDRTLLTAGALDPTFGVGGKVVTNFASPMGWSNPVTGNFNPASVAVQADGKILAVVAPIIANQFQFTTVRLNTDGSVDTTFGNNGSVTIDFGSTGNSVARAIAVQADGKIVVAGFSYQGPFAAGGTGDDFAVARLNSNGSLDTSFDGDGKKTIDFSNYEEQASSVAVLANGKIVVAGTTDSNYGNFAVACLNADGSLDASFDGDGRQTIDFAYHEVGRCVAVQADGKIVLAGFTYQIDTDSQPAQGDFAVVRLNANGGLDTSFNGNGKQTIDFGAGLDVGESVAIQADGKIVVAGTSSVSQSYLDTGEVPLGAVVARLNTNGSLDTSFNGNGKKGLGSGPDVYTWAYAMALQADGKIVLAGSNLDFGASTYTSYDFGVFRLNTNGSLDTSFNGSGTQSIDFAGSYDRAFGMALQADGKIVVAGAANGELAVARLVGLDPTAVGTAGDDNITIGPGTQAGTLKVTVVNVNGTTTTDNLASSATMLVEGGGGNDTFTVTAAPAASLILDGGSGSDTYNVTFGTLIAGNVVVTDSGVSGTDTLTANGTAANDTLNKTSGYVFWKLTSDSQYHVRLGFAGIESGVLHAAAGNDTVLDPDTTNWQLFGDDGDDTIILSATTGDGVKADGGDGSDSYIVYAGSLEGPVSISDSGTTGANSVSVVGTAGADTITQSDNTITADGGTITLGSGVTSLTIDGGGGAGDTLTISGTPTIPTLVTGVGDDMVVYGSSGNDTIKINPAHQGVTVSLNGTISTAIQPAGRIIVYGLAGDDDIQAAGGITNPCWLYGGDGNDRLKGGSGANVLVGGAGDDLLVGGSNRDILIGGTGADRIVGNEADDILIAGNTAFDANDAALSAILAEWTSSRSYAARVANMMGTGTGDDFANRRNMGYFLRVTDQAATTTVFDDGSADVLTGNDGIDWFFANLLGSGIKDKITDLTAAEFANDLTFIQGP